MCFLMLMESTEKNLSALGVWLEPYKGFVSACSSFNALVGPWRLLVEY